MPRTRATGKKSAEGGDAEARRAASSPESAEDAADSNPLGSLLNAYGSDSDSDANEGEDKGEDKDKGAKSGGGSGWAT